MVLPERPVTPYDAETPAALDVVGLPLEAATGPEERQFWSADDTTLFAVAQQNVTEVAAPLASIVEPSVAAEAVTPDAATVVTVRSEEHTSELQSH